MKVLLKYGFIFDPKETWDTQEQFEAELAANFKKRGLVAERIKASEGQEEVSIIMLYREPEIDSLT